MGCTAEKGQCAVRVRGLTPAGCAVLCSITRGHGILVSSGACSPEELRPVAAVLALAQLCGLTECKAEVGFFGFWLH